MSKNSLSNDNPEEQQKLSVIQRIIRMVYQRMWKSRVSKCKYDEGADLSQWNKDQHIYEESTDAEVILSTDNKD